MRLLTTSALMLAFVLAGCAGPAPESAGASETPSPSGPDSRQSEAADGKRAGEECVHLSKAEIANATTSERKAAGTVYVTVAQVVFGAWRWDYEGDRTFPIDCDTLGITFRVEWTDPLGGEVRVRLPCIDDSNRGGGPSPMTFTVEHAEIKFPDECRPGIIPSPLAPNVYLQPRVQYKWTATLAQRVNSTSAP